MSSSDKIQQFLLHKLREKRLSKKDFSLGSTIPYSTLCKIINGAQRNTELKTIIKIVDYFDCSLDEVTGRSRSEASKGANFTKLSPEEIGKNLKEFLNNKLTELSLNYYQLSKKCGFSDVTLYEFMQENTTKKTLGSTVMIGLADYFGVSLDEMVGRKTIAAQSRMPQSLKGLSAKDLQALEQVKVSVGLNASKQPDSKIHQVAKPKSTLTR